MQADTTIRGKGHHQHLTATAMLGQNSPAHICILHDQSGDGHPPAAEPEDLRRLIVKDTPSSGPPIREFDAATPMSAADRPVGISLRAKLYFDPQATITQQEAALDARASLAAGYAAAGRRAEALRIAGRLKLDSQHQYVPAYSLAEIHAALGQKDEAFAWLEKAYQERSAALAYLKVEPRMDGLRSDLRFRDLLRRMQLN